MAENKKTFIFYSDWINMVREMPSNDAGDLLKHILSYVNDESPTTDNILVKMAFGHMKPMIKSDLIKWDAIRKQRAEYGKKGGQAKAKHKLSKPKQLEAVNENVNDTDNINEIYKEKDHLRITWTEMNKLIDEFGEIKADDYVNQVLNYRKNVKYKSLYLTALKWLKRDFKKPTETKNTKLSI